MLCQAKIMPLTLCVRSMLYVSPMFFRAAAGPCLLVAMLAARLSVSAIAAEPSASQIEQARQFRNTEMATEAPAQTQTAETGTEQTVGPEDESFGVQQILKRQERLRPFNVFADASVFFTNNVALTRRDYQHDAFLTATFGASIQRPLTDALTLELTVKGGVFRYDKFTELDFESVDAGGGVSYRLRQLWNLTLFARYNFTDLISGESGDEFFQNHTFTLGAQKTFDLSRAHSIVTGLSGQWGISDPSLAERDEYTAYTGLQVQATRHLESDLFYRLSYFDYRENDRHDINQTITLSVRYTLGDWFSINATSYFGTNSSNQSTFDYDVINIGGGLGASLKF